MLPFQPGQPPTEYTGEIQAIWQAQQDRYWANWNLYTGDKWRELKQGDTKRAYRLGVNDIAMACAMHAQLLFGEVRDSSDPLIGIKVEPRRSQTISDDLLERAQDYLNELWAESNARKTQYEAALSSQVTGGVFWRVRYALGQENPFDLYPFKFEFLHADYVFPVFAPGTTTISEIFVQYKMTREAARAEFGVWSSKWSEIVEYREHWTSPLKGMAGTLAIQVGHAGAWETIKAEQNPFGFVPFVYIPHIPSKGFFGVPLAEWAGAVDLAEEYNDRLANSGDIIRQNSYAFGVLRGHPTGKPKAPFRLWKDGPTIVDLGTGNPGEPSPELDWFDPSEITNGTMEYLDSLKKELRMAMAVPPVAVGEDEGSQRSSLTLITRMFPIKSHIATERWLWTTGMGMLNRMALEMARIKKIGGLEGLDVRKLVVTSKWAPMLPRDRAELVNEMVQRQGVGHIHPKDALEQYEDTPISEIEAKYEEIMQHMKEESDIKRPPQPIQPAGDQPAKPKSETSE